MSDHERHAKDGTIGGENSGILKSRQGKTRSFQESEILWASVDAWPDGNPIDRSSDLAAWRRFPEAHERSEKTDSIADDRVHLLIGSRTRSANPVVT